jgi:hypothetical protein
VFGLIGVLCYFLSHDKNLEYPIFSTSNACFISGFVLVLVGGLSILSNLGAFDIFSYQFKRKGVGANKYTLYDHQQRRIEQSKTRKYYFVPYFVVGGLFLLVSFILTLVYYANINM